VQDFKYQMINKFSSIDVASLKQKNYNDMRGEIYLITSADSVWKKWKTVFEKHDHGDLIDPDTCEPFNHSARFKQMKPLVREFFRTLQGLTETEMEKAASHILHVHPTAKRCWVHPKICFSKPKSFVPSCYLMREWAENRKKKTTIVQELHKLVPEKQLIVDGEVHAEHWAAFKAEYKFTSASMAALIREAGDDFLKSKLVKGGKNRALPEHSAQAFSNFLKEKQMVTFEGDAHFNPVTFEPLKIQGFPGTEARKAIRVKAQDRFPFSIVDFRNIPGGSIEGAMSCPFYEPFLTKFMDYGCPRFREVDIWLWIVEDRKAEQVYEVVRKLQPEYAFSKSHYVAAVAEGAYSTVTDKKTKVVNVLCLYFVYKAELLKMPSHPLFRMEKLFQVPEGMGKSRSLYDEAKYANYPADELRMDFYLRMMRTLTKRGDSIFNVFGGSKPMYAAMVSYALNPSTYSLGRPTQTMCSSLGRPTQTKSCNLFSSSMQEVNLIFLIWYVQMSGLTVYSYVEDTDIQFYKHQKSLAKRMDILDWIPGSYVEEAVQGGESPMDMARRINPEVLAAREPAPLPEPLVGLHPGDSNLGDGGEAGEEEEEEDLPVEGDVEEGATGFTQESEAPLRKKAMLTATPQSKLLPALTIADARDMYSRDATATFRERRKLKGKKLYGDYSVEETIAISSEDEDDFELGKRLREEPTSPRVIASNIPVKPETLTVEEANERSRREEEQRLRLQKVAAEEPSMRNEVAELRALLMEQARQTAKIHTMMAQGLVMPTPTAFPQLSPPYPAQLPPPYPGASSSFAYQGMTHPHLRPYAPVQQVDDPHLWRQGTPGSSRPLTPPPLRPPLLMPPPHQQDDPRMFGTSSSNTPAPVVTLSVAPETREFGSTDPNLVETHPTVDEEMVEVEGPQGPGDTSAPNPVDEPMHDAHAEVGLGQRPDSQPLHEQVAAEGQREDGGDKGGAVHEVEASTSPRQDQGEVMH